MTRQQKIFAGSIAVIAVVIMASIWFVRAPYATLESIKAAAERRDVPELNRLIDFPSVKSSLKILLLDSMNGKPGEAPSPGAGLARLFASALAGPIVEAMVTPESIVAMFSGKLPRSAAGRPQPSSPRPDDASSPVSTEKPNVTFAGDWDDSSTIRVRVRSGITEDVGLAFVMRRDGLSWRLSGIER
ncbi:MAG: DUF2939 domain-containing protein [Pseudomonadota bacterium]